VERSTKVITSAQINPEGEIDMLETVKKIGLVTFKYFMKIKLIK
jgi:hypothetical protein